MKKKFRCLILFVVIAFVTLIYFQATLQHENKVGGLGRHKMNAGHRNRYVVGWDFHEGQTCASRNLLSLIHWAGDINFTVVEPCVRDSFFNLDNCIRTGEVNHSFRNDLLLFKDYFDLDYWNQQILSHNIGKPLVPWEVFINDIPPEAIVVYLLPGRGKYARLSVFVDEGIQKDAPNCYKQHVTSRPRFAKDLLNKLGVKVVREVCFRFDILVPIKIQWFNNQLLGNYAQSHIMILFSHWMGAFRGRLLLNYKDWFEQREPFDFMRPSQRVVEHSKKYRERFLGEDGYVAVALRTVKLAISLKCRKHKSQLKILHYLTEDCSNQVSSALEKVKGKRLLALDLGRFGDSDIPLYMEKNTVDNTVPKLVKIVYGNKWNWTQWEDSFLQATGGITDTGYIALMQKLLVTNAICIIIAGDGEFQKSLITEYETKAKDPCIHRVCSM